MIAFDGDGRMFVAEMRTYMQDIDGTGEHEPTSRVSLHWSSKGDGVYDQHTVFADKLLLPRMLLPLDKGRVAHRRDGHQRSLPLHRHRRRRRLGQKGAVLSRADRAAGIWSTSRTARSGRSITGSTRPTTPTACAGRRDGPPLKEPTAPNGGQWGVSPGRLGQAVVRECGRRKGAGEFPDRHRLWRLQREGSVRAGLRRRVAARRHSRRAGRRPALPPGGQDAQSLHRDLRRRDLSRRPAARGTARRPVLRRARRPARAPRARSR